MASQTTPIVISALLSGTNADILQGTRLQTVYANGILTFELSASVASATNFYTTSIQLPDGDTPLNGVLVPANGGTDGLLDDRNKLMASFRTGQGGHATFSVTETGTATLIYRVTFTPAAAVRR